MMYTNEELIDYLRLQGLDKDVAAADRIEQLEKALELYERERARFRHAHPEMTGVYFISSGFGDKDENLLPEFIEIVPAYGCAWTQIYQRTDKTRTYEGS